MKELLISLNACEDAMIWAADKTWPEIFATCHRGDWLLWLFKKTNSGDLKLLTLAKGHCAATVKHLIKDKRSIAAVEAAIKFGNGEISRDELNAAAGATYAAADAAAAAAAAAAYAAADADAAAYADADADAYAAAAAAYAAAAADAAADAAAAAAADAAADAAAARKTNQLLTANIVRKYIPIDKWNIKL